MADGFTKKYNLTKLVYYEIYDDVYTAISKEKQIKGGPRRKKINLTDNMNSHWKDLYNDL